ncbi:MAG: SIMPL domain-containing protein [Gammaproteobacteria bacterium]|nr:SIMPL domain-containing protein [Gammaproteobacteria bacterium]
MIRLSHAFATLLFLSPGLNTVWAHDNETHYDRVYLSARATAQLENDTMVAIVYAQEEGAQAAELSSIVNKRVRWGLERVKKYPEIKHQTNAYSSDPVYSNNKIKGWRVRQSLRLESQDMTLMSDVLGDLQAELAVQAMHFTVSPASKNHQDEKLIDEALQAFENRAQQLVKKLGRKNFKIVDINISTSGTQGIRPQYKMQAMAMDVAESAPVISAGEQTVSVTVSGNIELE